MAKTKVDDTKLIAALLCSPTMDAAAEAAGISRTTLYERRRDPEFAKKLKEAQAVALADTARFLQHSTGTAAAVLLDIAEDCREGAQVRVSAAKAILEQAARFTEIVAFEERLEALERMAENEE